MPKKVLFIATAENRELIHVDTDDDMPELSDPVTDEIIDYRTMCSTLEKQKDQAIAFIIQQNGWSIEPTELQYATVDPAYSSEPNSGKTDSANYIGHQSVFFKDYRATERFDALCVMSAYLDFFSRENIQKATQLLKPGGMLLNFDSVPYRLPLMLFQHFNGNSLREGLKLSPVRQSNELSAALGALTVLTLCELDLLAKTKQVEEEDESKSKESLSEAPRFI